MDLLLSYLNNYGNEYNKHKACNKNAHKIRVLFRLGDEIDSAFHNLLWKPFISSQF